MCHYKMPGLKPPYRLLIVGRPHCGKTHSLTVALKKKIFGSFHKVILFSPTAFSTRNKVWNGVVNKEDIHLKWSLARFDTIYSREVRKNEKNPSRHTLFILDDCAGIGLRGRNPTNPTQLDNALTTCSHYNISIIIMSQMVNLLPTSARACSEAVMIFEPTNEFEAENLYRAFGRGKHADWLQRLHDCTSQPYNFMFIDKSGTNIKTYHNLDEQLHDPKPPDRKRRRQSSDQEDTGGCVGTDERPIRRRNVGI